MLKIQECKIESSYWEERRQLRKLLESQDWFSKLDNLEKSKLIDDIYKVYHLSKSEEEFRARAFLLLCSAAITQ